MLKPAAIFLLLGASAAQADLAVTFTEGAPKDSFAFTNTGDCVLPAFDLTLDLGTAPAGLIFDVTAAGAGVQVFQPLALIAGQEMLTNTPRVRDGDNVISFSLKGLAPGQRLAFTIDVDDTGGARETVVNGSEIQGTQIRAQIGGSVSTGVLGSNARGVVELAGCTS